MLGTKWVAKGEGATIWELRDALMKSTCSGDGTAAFKKLGDLLLRKRKEGSTRTNLELTGAELCSYDLERISCII